jgi:putative intracellular protease/amidase
MARIAFVLIDPFADWEPALLAANAKSELGDEVRWLTPGGREVRSMGGLTVKADGAYESFEPAHADALLFIGSPEWEATEDPGFAAAARRAAEAGLVVGGICGATLVLARAGLLDDRAHTSNSLKFLQTWGGAYRGSAHYRDTARAVSDRKVVSSSGLAPVSFASEVLKLLHPEAQAMLVEGDGMFAREHQRG